MPDKDGFPTPQEIINGYGKSEPTPIHFIDKVNASKPLASHKPGKNDILEVYMENLNTQQQKAIHLILSKKNFILIAAEETAPKGSTEKTGANFFTALNGDKHVLSNIKGELDGVIDRLYKKNNIQ